MIALKLLGHRITIKQDKDEKWVTVYKKDKLQFGTRFSINTSAAEILTWAETNILNPKTNTL